MTARRTIRRNVLVSADRLEQRTLFTTLVGLTSTDQLVTFDSATPATTTNAVAVTGLGASESLLGIDYRPATGQLYGLGSTGQLYTINSTTGAATAVGTPLTITGTNFGFDFNPQVDRIRVVSDADANFRAVPGTGAAVTPPDTNLAYATGDANAGANPNVVAAAYNNNFASTSSTTLYVIDTTLDILATQGSGPGVTPVVSPNTGQLFTVGALGIDVDNNGAFDVAESDGVAYATFGAPGGGGGGGGGAPSTLYTINLTTGAATAVGTNIGNNLVIKGLAAVPPTRSLFALASSGTAFATIDTTNLATNPTLTNITGLASGQTLTSIDFRPATGQLFGSTGGGQLYTIDPATGAATALGAGLGSPLTGNVADIDFNPTVDRLRVVTDTDDNARANPDTGALVDSNLTTDGTQIDTALAYASTDAGNGSNPDVVAAAYSNSVQGATGTTLFAIDAGRDQLVSIGSAQGAGTTVSPNTGQLFSVGAIGVDVVSGGMDIANGGAAYALINATGGTGTQLYTINTGTGAATLVGTVGDGTQTFADVAIGSAVLSVSPATQNVAENAGNATITVNRAGDSTGAASVNFELVAVPSGTDAATAGEDFGTAGQTTLTGTVTFADGETSKTITVPIINDTSDEPDESFIVGLTGASGAALGSTVQSTVVITDDDEPVTPGTATLAADPVRTTGKATQVLTVQGTGGDDVIVIAQQGANVVATLNGTPLSTTAPVKGLYRVVVYGGAGNDEIRLNSKAKVLSIEAHGEGGDDLLIGGKGRDLLVGGDGVDSLYGRAGDDILIGGISDYTSNPTATATLLNAWITKGTFESRANAISTGSGVNNFIFSTNTIDDDTDRDYLAADGTTDLVFTQAKDGVVDEANKGRVTAI